MNSNWQHKIQQHEAVPPQGTWNNIANMLDREENLNAGFASRLAAYETFAPVSTQKNIFDLLDAAEGDSFKHRLYSYAPAAPATAWPQIVTELDKAATKIIPFEPRTRQTGAAFLRVAAAITIIALLSVTVWLLKPGKDVNEVVNNTAIPKPFTGTPKNNTSAADLPATITPQKQDNNTVTTATTPKEKNKSSEKNITGTAYVTNNDVIILAQNPAAARAEKLQNSNGETPEDIALFNNGIANSYITITGPDGQAVRVSSKFAALVSYLSDNNPDAQENIEIIIKESAKWRATFALWRDKMTNNSIAPTPNNFMDIIELSNVLEEKK
jgi:hypothetical protein